MLTSCIKGWTNRLGTQITLVLAGLSKGNMERELSVAVSNLGWQRVLVEVRIALSIQELQELQRRSSQEQWTIVLQALQPHEAESEQVAREQQVTDRQTTYHASS